MSGYLGFGNGRSGIKVFSDTGSNQRTGIRISPGGAVTSGEIHTSGGILVKGNLVNTTSGKIKMNDTSFTIEGDLLNSGDITINDPERIKQLLVESVKAGGTLAELGGRILKTFFTTN